MKSRRKNRRLTIMGMGSLKVEGDRKTQEVYIANTSKGGAGIYINKPLKVGTGVHITFTQRDLAGERRFEEQPGTIAWCSRCGSVYAVGIKFADNR
ncbi:MAG: PilZ domain-containing protein [Nitrospirota bacterium]